MTDLDIRSLKGVFFFDSILCCVDVEVSEAFVFFFVEENNGFCC